MKKHNRPIKNHIDTLDNIFDKHCQILSAVEKDSLNAAMHVLDQLERNNSALTIKNRELKNLG